MSEQSPIIQFSDITKRYGRQSVLDGVDLAVRPNDFTVIYGPPASGKSVLMRLLMGLEEPTTGTISVRGADVTTWPAADRNIGYVPQSFALYPHLSVHDNIAYPLKLAGVSTQEAEPVVRQAAAMLKIEDLLTKRPDQLSGGQKQRVAIARGIAKRTDLFVLDDPLAGLDFKLREQLVDDLRQLQQESRATFLYTTSDTIEAMTLADRLAVLDGGTIVEAGEADRLYLEPQRSRTMALVGFPPANFIGGTLESRDGATWCRTDLFSVPISLLPEAAAGAAVMVGIRPEALSIRHTNGANRTDEGTGAIAVDGRVVLREDLGGEEIIYVDCAGTQLAGVDRDHDRMDDLDERVTVGIRARDVVLFAPDTGQRVGRGAG